MNNLQNQSCRIVLRMRRTIAQTAGLNRVTTATTGLSTSTLTGTHLNGRSFGRTATGTRYGFAHRTAARQHCLGKSTGDATLRVARPIPADAVALQRAVLTRLAAPRASVLPRLLPPRLQTAQPILPDRRFQPRCPRRSSPVPKATIATAAPVRKVASGP